MVLQKEADVTIWGWTTATSETISVIGSWNNTKITVEAYQGVWSLLLPTPSAGGPFTLTIEGHEKLVIQNVLIGEVWMASGQSNMEWTPTAGLVNAEEEINNANYPDIRFFQINRHLAKHPQDDTPGYWVECSPETMKDFSSVAYFFGRNIHDKVSVPVGLIHTSWGGTPVETWIAQELIEADKELKDAASKITEKAWWPNGAGLAYNAMIYPLANFNIAGCIWYHASASSASTPSVSDPSGRSVSVTGSAGPRFEISCR